MSMAVFTGLYCLVIFAGYRQLFRDADTGWHIRAGERMIERRQLIRADPYSFTAGGKPWFTWEWGADVLLGAVHRAGGLPGIVLLFSTIIALCVWMWVRLSFAAGGDFLLSLLFLSPFLTASSLHWLARPHVLAWPLTLLAVWAAESCPTRFRPQHGVILFLVGFVWANIHASFFLAPIIGLLYALGYAIRPVLWPRSAIGDRARAGWLTLGACIFFAATFLNPFGWNLHLHVLDYLTNTELLARVAEFQSFNFHAAGAGQIVLTIVLSFLGVGLAIAARHPGRAFVILLLSVLSLRSARVIPVVALVCLPLVNASLASWLRSLAGHPMLARILKYSSNLRAIDAQGRGWLWAPAAFAVCWMILANPAIAAQTGFSPDEFPVAASRQVVALPAEARILSTDKFGGYLIYRFNGQRPVFFDGRSDFYGAAFMKSYLRLMEVRPGWRDLLRQHALSHALLPADAPLREALRTAGWKELYSDSVAALLENLERPGN